MSPAGKRLLFVNFYIHAGRHGINHGIAYLAAIPRKYSFQVACLNINCEIEETEFVKIVSEFAPAVIAFSSTYHQLKYLFKYSLALGKNRDILQIAGGAGPTLEPEKVLCRSAIDGVCIGEGDVPLDGLLGLFDRGGDIRNAEGFYWKTEQGILKNPIPPFIEDLSCIPYPDYSIYSQEVFDANGDEIRVMLSRGCPYGCSYCCNSAFGEIYHPGGDSKKYFRLPSVEYSIGLLEHLVSQYPEKKYIEFDDDLLVTDKAWFKKFSQEYRVRIGLPYALCARIECVDEELVGMLKDSGCTQIMVGVESGDESFRREFLNRNYSNRSLLEKCGLIRSSGIGLFTFNMIGFPFESVRQMRKTLLLNENIKPDCGQCTVFFPYKGTDLYRLCQESDLLLDEEESLGIPTYNHIPGIRMSAFHRKACQYFKLKLESYFREREHLSNGRKNIENVHSPSDLLYRRFPVLYWIAKSIMRMIRDRLARKETNKTLGNQLVISNVPAGAVLRPAKRPASRRPHRPGGAVRG